MDKSALIIRVLTLPALEKRPRADRFTRLSTAERIRCIARLEGRLRQHLGVDPDPTIAGWRRSIIAGGGVAPALESLPRLLKRGSPVGSGARPKSRRLGGEADAGGLQSLLSAYIAVNMRREQRRFKRGEFQVVSSAASTSLAPSKV